MFLIVYSNDNHNMNNEQVDIELPLNIEFVGVQSDHNKQYLDLNLNVTQLQCGKRQRSRKDSRSTKKQTFNIQRT